MILHKNFKNIIVVVFLATEYCEKYAKKNSLVEEESSDEDISDGQCTSSDDDDIPGHADP